MNYKTIIKQLSEAANALKLLAQLNRIHRKPYKNLLNLSKKLEDIIHDYTEEADN